MCVCVCVCVCVTGPVPADPPCALPGLQVTGSRGGPVHAQPAHPFYGQVGHSAVLGGGDLLVLTPTLLWPPPPPPPFHHFFTLSPCLPHPVHYLDSKSQGGWGGPVHTQPAHPFCGQVGHSDMSGGDDLWVWIPVFHCPPSLPIPPPPTPSPFLLSLSHSPSKKK